MKRIAPKQLVAMDEYTDSHPIRIHLDYAHDDNLLFGERIYRKDARLWLFEDLAKVVLRAAQLCHERHGLRFVLYDGLRTVEAQAKMLETQRVRDNPHWLEEPRLLSPPGAGGHPRGMAIDIALEDTDGNLIEMGTPFDYLAEDSSPEANPAHREHVGLSDEVKANRAMLDSCMNDAAAELGVPLFLLPEEWWDFRFPPEISEQYAPLSDNDLPAAMRMMD